MRRLGAWLRAASFRRLPDSLGLRVPLGLTLASPGRLDTIHSLPLAPSLSPPPEKGKNLAPPPPPQRPGAPPSAAPDDQPRCGGGGKTQDPRPLTEQTLPRPRAPARSTEQPSRPCCLSQAQPVSSNWFTEEANRPRSFSGGPDPHRRGGPGMTYERGWGLLFVIFVLFLTKHNPGPWGTCNLVEN